MCTCCLALLYRSIQQWFKEGTIDEYKYIVPEISRAGYFSSTAYSAQSQPLSNLAMSMPRTAARYVTIRSISYYGSLL